MNKLKESLDLLDKIENHEEYKNMLDERVTQLLREYDFTPIREGNNVGVYVKGEEVFARITPSRGDNTYCWAKPRNLNTQKIYKDFKKTLGLSGLQISAIAGFTCCTTFLAMAAWICVGVTYNIEPENTLFGLLGSALMVTGWFVPTYFGIGYFTRRNREKLRSNCKEIFYGKEALEKAFGR